MNIRFGFEFEIENGLIDNRKFYNIYDDKSKKRLELSKDEFVKYFTNKKVPWITNSNKVILKFRKQEFPCKIDEITTFLQLFEVLSSKTINFHKRYECTPNCYFCEDNFNRVWFVDELVYISPGVYKIYLC